MNAAVHTHSQSGANCFLRLGRADGNNNRFRRGAGFLQTHGLLDGNFVKRVHGHFHIGKVNAALVSFDPRFDIVIKHALDGDKNFHLCLRLFKVVFVIILSIDPACLAQGLQRYII